MVNPPIYVSCIKQFWALVSVKKTNDVVKLQAIINKKKVVITEDTIRQALRLDDANGLFSVLVQRGLPVMNLVLPCPQMSSALPQVAHFEQDKVAQALEITKLKQRVKKLEKKRRSKSSSLKREDGRDVTVVKEVNAAEPIVFDDEEEKEDLERAKVIQQQYDQKQENIDWNVVVEQMQEKHLDNFKKYQCLKRKPIAVAQSRKNIIVYLKNMARYKIQHFKGMTYDQVRPIFKREYNKVQTFINSDRDEEPTKKRAAKETLLHESFKKLRAKVEVSDDVFWKLQISMHYPIMWKLHPNCGVHQVSSTTRRYDIYMLAEKDYPFSNHVMTLMLSSRLQVEEDSEVAKYLVMKILLKVDQPKSKSLDTSSN
uniref:Xylulose kinase-1 n=1 Tax=Tanacetum cinerariifolium TaxID=118510 RepID=A0A6L2LUP1_TANCI|nr:hypothetical protein [Tanacetum cinerariifolium]